MADQPGSDPAPVAEEIQASRPTIRQEEGYYCRLAILLDEDEGSPALVAHSTMVGFFQAFLTEPADGATFEPAGIRPQRPFPVCSAPPAHPDAPEAGLERYLADLCHEWASPERTTVRRLS